jgi:butyrate kinase
MYARDTGISYEELNLVVAHLGGGISVGAQAGNQQTELILEALCYQVAKEAGAMSAALKGDVNAIILTGGIAYNAWIIDKITQFIQFIAPVHVYPGEDETAALAMNVQMVLSGEMEAKEYR